MNLKKTGKVFTSKFVGTVPSSYKKKRIYRAVVSQRLRNIVLERTSARDAMFFPSLYEVPQKHV